MRSFDSLVNVAIDLGEEYTDSLAKEKADLKIRVSGPSIG